MVVGLLTMELHFPQAQSLKDKRKILKGLILRTRKKYNVSFSEISYQDKWQRSMLAVVCVANLTSLVYAQLNKIADEFAVESEVILLNHTLEMI